jgi:transposase
VPKSPLTALERAAAVVLIADAQPLPVVAAKLDTTTKTVQKWVEAHEDNGDVEDAYRPGRKPTLSSDQMAAIVDFAIKTPKTTPRVIKAMLRLRISCRTVRRVLDEAGLFARVSRISPPLTDAHLRMRLSFGNGYGGWTETQWMGVLWSDEMSIRVGPQGRTWVQRLINAEWFPVNVVEKQKHAAKVHVWGCFSGRYGVGEIHVFTENLDAVLMRDILRQHLKRSARALIADGDWWFQQDNDPKHKSKLVQDLLHCQGIRCLDWPPYSPDLNPIENLWADLKKRVEKENARTVEELKAAVYKQWMATGKEYCAKLATSMLKRCKAVVACDGRMTGY